MKYNVPRSKVPTKLADGSTGLLPGKSRGIKRHNRRVIATYRRMKRLEAQRMPRIEAKEVVQSHRSLGSSSSRSTQPIHSSTPVPPQRPTVYWYNIAVARNQNGDCPNCGSFGAHRQAMITKIDSNYNRSDVTIRRCGSCYQYFEDLPASPLPAEPHKLAVIDYGRLLQATDSFNDCPHEDCTAMDVGNRVEVRDSATSAIHTVLRCHGGHHFKPYACDAVSRW